MACKYFIDGKQLSEQELKSYVSDKYIDSKDIKFTTLDDIANILAYSNSKIILDGWKVEYSTPLGNKYDTLEEVNNEIRGLADANVEVDLSNINLNKDSFTNIPSFANVFEREGWQYRKKWDNTWERKQEGDLDYSPVSDLEAKKAYHSIFTDKTIDNTINQFIEKNKEYEQSREIIEQWKKENNIQYDPEEVYSRGQGFYSSIGAYSNLELDLLFQNLLQHIEDNKKASENYNKELFYLSVRDVLIDAVRNTELYERYNGRTLRSGNSSDINTLLQGIKESNLNLNTIVSKLDKRIEEELKKPISSNFNPSTGMFEGYLSEEEKNNFVNKLKNQKKSVEDYLNSSSYGFTISAFTKPVNKRLKHIEGTGDRVRFVIYPQSEHIKWAAPTDVYSGSVWDANTKVSTDKKSELLGVSYTKSPSLNNVNKISPNLSEIIDSLEHAHNELAIELTEDNFEIEFDENIDYSTKQLINSINKIIQQKRLQSIENKINQLEKQCN